MPTLKEMLKLICETSQAQGIPFGDQCAKAMEMEIRKAWPAERIYIPPADSRRDPARGDEIRRASVTLPTGVICERFGISRQLIAYHTKKRR